MGKNASARVKSKVKNKFIRAIRRADAQELSREQYFKDRARRQKKDESNELREQKSSVHRK